jgi:hypothetical protein
LKQAVVGHVITHCPMRLTRALPSAAVLKPKTRTLTPGRPSGVSAAGISASMPASASHPITDVA